MAQQTQNRERESIAVMVNKEKKKVYFQWNECLKIEINFLPPPPGPLSIWLSLLSYSLNNKSVIPHSF